RDGVPFMLPDVTALEKLIGELGIAEDSHVVVVPAGVSVLDFGAAARVYWTLKVAGIATVSILDGGFKAWTEDASYPLEGGARRPSPTIFTVALERAMIAQTADVETIESAGGATLLDARPASFYAGKERALSVAAYGHIPGARNLDSAEFYDAAADRLKSPAELAAIAAAIPPGPVVSYCNTGHWGATNWFVLSEILGRKDVRLYYGSMTAWTAAPGHAVVSARSKWDDLKKTLGFGS
ncbi:MAG: sulfurtransferase, partial [Proteobacteria bacterium]|nr:sulfurtransferase [Pseudomonadota bacterium]